MNTNKRKKELTPGKGELLVFIWLALNRSYDGNKKTMRGLLLLTLFFKATMSETLELSVLGFIFV